MSDLELLARVDAVSRERALLEAELLPRRKEEATVLARLRSRQSALQALISSRKKAITRDEAACTAAQRRRDELQAGLNARGKLWARVGEPLGLSLTLLLGLATLGLGRSFKLSLTVLLVGVLTGLFARRLWRLRRGG